MRIPVRPLLFLSILLLAAGFVAYTIQTPGWRPVVISVYDGPVLEVENRVVDVGTVKTDRKIRTEFLLYNKGGKHLRLLKVDASCGCTVPEITQKVVSPGDFAKVQVDIDTSLKVGKLRKKLTLYSNDEKRPVLPLFVIGQVVAAPAKGHAMLSLQPRDRLALFKGECATCHTQKGIGKTGEALFQADCAMCHGQNALGNLPSGPSLLSETAKVEDERWVGQIRKTIANGSPHSVQMPPFSEKVGGPLSDDQISSLATFLKVRQIQFKMGNGQPQAPSVEGESGDGELYEEAVRNPH